VEAGNVATLAQTIEKLTGSKIRRGQRGRAARTHVVENFDISTAVDAINNVYQKWWATAEAQNTKI